MPYWAYCLQKGCRWYTKAENATHDQWFRHYFRKGRDVLIELALVTMISDNPYILPTYIITEKLVQYSKYVYTTRKLENGIQTV